MEINNIKLIILSCLVFISIEVSSNKIEKIEHALKIPDTQNDKFEDKRSNSKNLLDIEILYNDIFIRKNKKSFEVKSFNDQAGQNTKTLILQEDEFVNIKGADKKERLFNGSIIIKFIENPNLNDFAINNDISFVGDLSELNRGVFKINNLYEFKDKIKILQQNNNIVSIELNELVLDQIPY
tara:strand:- start:102 stop:647 length:546 start_codon:yes stop_codon:yes gene_type:complete